MGTCCSSSPEQKADEFTEPQTDRDHSSHATSSTHTGSANYSTPSTTQAYNSPDGTSPNSSYHNNNNPSSQSFLQRLEQGMAVLLILSTGRGINSLMKCETSQKKIILSKGANSRTFTFDDIDRVMHSKKDMQRIQNQANLAEDPHCSALLLKTGSSIILRFAERADNLSFIAVMENLLSRFQTGRR